VRGGKYFGLVQSAVGGDGDGKTGGGECFHEGSGRMVSIEFTPRGDEEIREKLRNKKEKYRKA
jgi:hypothetical protein